MTLLTFGILFIIIFVILVALDKEEYHWKDDE